MWVQLVLMLASMAISYASRPKPKNAKSAGLSEFQISTAEDGRELGVLFGTRRIKSPNVVWYGDLRSTPIRKRA
jgi:hypothetical protein